MRIFWRFSTSDAGTLTASNTASGYAASNLQLNTLGSKWASDTSSATAQLLIDFGSAVDIDSFALLGHNLVPGSDSVTLKYADDSGISVNVQTISVTLTATNWFEFFSTVTKRYAEVLITKSAPANQVYAGRLVHGESYQPTYGLKPGYSIGPGRSGTTTVRTRGGQLYSNTGPVYRALNGALPPSPDADRYELEALMETNSTAIPFIIAVDWENYPTQKSIYGTLDSIMPFMDVANGSWDWSLKMTEQK